MKFKIDENLARVAQEIICPAELNLVSRNLCRRFIDAGMIEDLTDYFGETVLVATGPQYVADVCKVLAGYLYNDETRSIPSDVFDAFCKLIVMGDGDCPECGGELKYVEAEEHELNDGDYYCPNSIVIDNYVYTCRNCGATIKMKK